LASGRVELAALLLAGAADGLGAGEAAGVRLFLAVHPRQVRRRAVLEQRGLVAGVAGGLEVGAGLGPVALVVLLLGEAVVVLCARRGG
jgi:hypothetical protein